MIQRFTVLLCLLIGASVMKCDAQLFGNEWINYSQSYYKFKIDTDRVYRIPVSSLFNAGMPATVNGSDLQLFRDGEEVAIFVNNPGLLTAADYIEFYGFRANSKVEEPLYKDVNWQLNPNQNLVSDTAFYFVTYNNQPNHKRYTPIANDLTNLPQKENYIWDKFAKQYRENFNGGPSYEGKYNNPVLYLNSSQYENAEGFSKKTTVSSDSIVYTCPFPYIDVSGPPAQVQTSVVGNSYLAQHRIKIFANGNQIADETYSEFNYKRVSTTIPMTWLTALNKMSFKYTPINTGLDYPDRYGIVSLEFRFPRLPNFGNSNSFYFELEPKPSDYYLEITNFVTNNTQPRLYDLGSQTYIMGDIATPGMVRFRIPASNSVRKLALQNQAAASYPAVANLQAIQFRNYTDPAQQGNFLILSHKNYMDDGTGHNYLDDYKNYRNTMAGGGYQAIVADVQDIYNEFGYGYTFSPLAIRNFLKYAAKSPTWTPAPRHAFIVGKGVGYAGFLKYTVAPYSTYPYYAIPSFGEPSSDVLFTDFDKNNIPQLSIGRLPVMNPSEIRDYLQKVKDHEAEVQNTSHQVSDSILWRKRILHMAGTKSAAEQAAIVASLNSQANIISNPYYGGKVTLVKKGSTTEVEDANSKLVDDLFNSGISLLQFFGHSSSTGIDYNLDFPESYTNYKRYPVFIANGCSAGDIFILQGGKSLGERFVLAPVSGSIAFIASVNTGYTNYLSTYTDSLYTRFSRVKYGATLGEQIQDNVKGIMTSPQGANNSLRTHCEQIALNGDPSTMMFAAPKPDYAVEEKSVTFKQFNLTTTTDSLDLDVVVYNLGKYTTDTIGLLVTRTLPNNAVETILYKHYPGIAYSDTVHLKIPTYGDLGLGVNSIEVSIDNEALVDEVTELNNNIKKIFTIYNDDLVPVYPYDFSIVTQQGVTLKGSTLNPFAALKKYVIQIDTTERFNSPQLLSTSIESTGGVIKWTPTINLQDSVVYYWRTAMDTLYGNHFHRWSGHSFIYLNNGNEGWNQSHYFQLQKDEYSGIYLDSVSRLIKFEDQNKKLQVQTVALNGPSPFSYFFSDYLVKVNGSTIFTFGCPNPSTRIGNLQFMIIDSLTGEPLKNTLNAATGKGKFGSVAPCRVLNNQVYEDPFFEFTLDSLHNRNAAMAFFDSIPSGYYVMMRNRICIGNGCGTKNTRFINQWMADTLQNGPGVSLYHKVKDFGFTMIDSFYKNRPFSFFMRKDMPATVVQNVGIDSTIKLFAEYSFKSYLFSGTLESTKIGPARSWTHFYRKGKSLDATPGDSVAVELIGISQNNVETVLSTNWGGDTSLNFISALSYPYLKLRMSNSDNIHATPEQVKYMRVHYQPEPEAALNPNRHFTFRDTVGQGQKQTMSLAIENLSPLGMDSMLVKFEVIDKNKNRIPLATRRYKPLPLLDTIHVDLDFNTSNIAGENILVIEANPDNDQAEQFHPNNIGYKSFYVVGDNKNPLIDVTFDGVHIFDEDIVSARPLINITLKDENKYLALDDTSLVSVYLKYPGENLNVENYIPFDGTILKFIPATGEPGKNKASVEFRPNFVLDGNDYVLTVKAKDKTGNVAGNNAYKVRFRVINKPSISSVINYPNPFTTSTQFIFTITGSQIPSNLKIQVLTPTGKVVREILKSELGDLHIGRNITEFKWKGDDQFGAPLANGVYLYRFITNLNGSKMDHFDTGADKWIEKGFGKLYIMR